MSLIPKLTLSSGTELINVPASKEVLAELGVPESQMDDLIEQAKWPEIRQMRDRLLKESDWTQIPDCSISQTEKDQWKTYRHMLRDIPQTNLRSDEIVWPDEPK